MSYAPGGFQGNPQHGGQGLQAPNPYQHLHQGGSSNATPSPTMQNQQFRPPPNAQRMQTMSPHPFPQQQGMAMSPTPDQTSRGFGMNPAMSTAGFNNGMPVQGVALSQNLQQRQADAQRIYQMRLQQQQQQIAANNFAQQRQQQQPGGMNMLGSSGQQMNPAMAMAGGMRPNQPPMGMGMGGMGPNKAQEPAFMNTLAQLMQSQGLPFNPQPTIAMRPVNLFQLYTFVLRHRGSKNVTQSNAWPQLAQLLGFPPQAGQELRMIYEQNLAPYEQAWLASKRRQGQAGPMPGAGGAPQTPVKPMASSAQDLQAQQQQYVQSLRQRASMQASQPPVDQGTPIRNNSVPAANGWGTPQTDSNAASQQEAAQRKSMSRQLESTPQPQAPGSVVAPSPGPDQKVNEPPKPADGPELQNGASAATDKKISLDSNFTPRKRQLADTYGGLSVQDLGSVGEKVAKLKPDVPNTEEMGVIDLRAISMSLQSGLHLEVRYALDVLTRLSHDPRLQLELDKCEDLMDAIVDCAEDQVDALSEDAAEVSDIIDLSSYEDVMRNCRAELESLQDVPEFGSVAYDMDRAADRLIAITTILRNLSFFESNHAMLSSTPVIKFISNTVRLLGTRIMLLRNNVNTVDFMKDVITFLSNTSDKIELPTREDAFNILNFLLAFAPTPLPNANTPLRFTSYNPSVHRYLPPAVDCLAKLLARDDPNRHFYKQLFLSDTASTPPFDLLTRAFGLAICVVPEKGRRPEARVAEARKPYLIQGMLAADILASLCPGPDTGLARSWLEAEDGWAKTLVFLSGLLSVERQAPQPPPVRGMPRQMDHMDTGFGLVTHRALAMLKKLGEKAMTEEELKDKRLSIESLPKDEVLLGALSMQHMDGVALKRLCSFAQLKG
ncbi:uncharacterized protein BKA78DRAFT_246320 [Phyllosticta capitalensis]|uniref:uncharacterized protein n=1 Tax=Phyllosticta capitalensis TaxID=121624 RepID=UPI00312D1ED7